jgi:tetratricopeptide (TPR) repeat protein
VDACGSACGLAGCGGYSQASDAEWHPSGTQVLGAGSNEEVIYDGPAPGSTIYEGPASDNGETTYPDEARSNSRTSFRLVSNAHQDGSAAFQKGMTSFRSHVLAEALGSFETAVAAEPDNAMYHYYLALTLYDLHGADVAGEVLQQAVALERREPIVNWGKRMERVQGRARSWIESARRDVGLVR